MPHAGRWAAAGLLVLLATACRNDDDGAATGDVTSTTAPATTSLTTTSATDATVDATTTTTTSTAAIPIPIPIPTTPATRASFPDDAAAVDGVAAGFLSPGSPLTPDAAHCIGDGLVHVFGRDKVEQLGFGIGRWTLLGFSLALGPWNPGDSAAVVDTFRVCSPAWKLLMVDSATSGADRLDEVAQRCVADAIADDRAHDLFVTLLDRPSDPHLETALAELQAAYSSCLTPAQLATLDWD